MDWLRSSSARVGTNRSYVASRNPDVMNVDL